MTVVRGGDSRCVALPAAASRLSKMTIMPGDDIGLGRQLIVVQILLRVLMAK